MTRRAFVILAVMVVVGSAIFIVTGLIVFCRAEVAGSVAHADSVQARAIAWSGVQAVMAQLADQRDAMLRGETPTLDQELSIYDSGGEQGVARVLEMGSTGARFVAESSRADLNGLDAAAIERVGGLPSGSGSEVVALRGNGFESVTDLLRLPWVTPEMFYGDLSQLNWRQDSEVNSDRSERGSRREAGSGTSPLADRFTVFAVEPEVDETGAARLNVNAEWNEQLARRLARRTSDAFAQAVGAWRTAGNTFRGVGEVFSLALSANLPAEEIPAFLDAVSVGSDPYRLGCLNINLAGRDALASLAGLDEETIDRILALRESVPADEKKSPTWIVQRNIVTNEQFAALADRICVRQFSFRVRIAAVVRYLAEDEPQPVRCVLEAVIDCADEQPRIATVREITHLPAMAAIIRLEELAAADNSEEIEAPSSAPTSPEAKSKLANDGELENGEAAPEKKPTLSDDEDSADVGGADKPSDEDQTPEKPAGRRRIGRWLTG